ncbi:MAG: type 2 lantipeptide synthetase LanM [Oscillospiraceae bacterium]|nr:type 2 lantipeptide synthetase LanM [Oscillospiraceae bacterium]
MNVVSDSASKNEIFEFWKSFFPEFSTIDEIDEILKKISDVTLDELFIEYKNEAKSDYAEKFFDFEESKEKDGLSYNNIKEIISDVKWGHFFLPVLKFYLPKLFILIKNSEIIKNKKEFLPNLVLSLLKDLLTVSYQVLVFEINLAKNEKLLAGKTSKERADYFDKVLLKDENFLKNIYFAYPELIRLLDLTSANFINYIEEIITEITFNLKKLNEVFNTKKQFKKLEKIEFNLGDMHNGKSVSKLIFGNEKIIIYKPNTLGLESGYEKLIDFLNKNKIKNFIPLKAAKAYNGSNCCFMEYIENSKCDSQEEIVKFYRRMGELLCIAYTLKSNDLHYENLITQNGQPILLDLETLLGQDTPILNKQNLSANEKALFFINESVRKSILLSVKIKNSKNNSSIDIGGLREKGEVVSPFRSLLLKNIESDEVYMTREFVKMHLDSHRPDLNVNNVRIDNYAKDIKFGFSNLYKWICKNKELYIEKLSDIFSKYCARIILKPTRIYTQILTTGFHPDLLQNKIDRFVYLHRIGLLFKLPHGRFDARRKIFASEIREMQNGNVPYFYEPVRSDIIFNSKKEKIDGFYKNSILEEIKNKIYGMTKEDLIWQKEFIESRFKENNIELTGFKFQNFDEKNLKFKCFQLSEKIGNYILDQSFVGQTDKKPNRTFIRKDEDGIFGFTVTDNYLHEGNAGIAFFLFYLGRILNIENFKKASFEVINSILEYFNNNDNKNFIPCKQKFTSVFEILYVIFKIDQISDNFNFKEFVFKKINLIENFITENENKQIENDIIPLIYLFYAVFGNNADFHKKAQNINNKLLLILEKHLSLVKQGKIKDFIFSKALLKLCGDNKSKISEIINNHLNWESAKLSHIKTLEEILILLANKIYLLNSEFKDSCNYSDLNLLLEKFRKMFSDKKLKISVKELILISDCSNFLENYDFKINYLHILNNVVAYFDKKINFKLKFIPLGLMNGISGVGLTFLKSFNNL